MNELGSTTKNCAQQASGDRLSPEFDGDLGLAWCGVVRAHIRRPFGRMSDSVQIGQADVVRPSVAADLYRVGAPIIRTVDQEAANAGRPHFPEGGFFVGA